MEFHPQPPVGLTPTTTTVAVATIVFSVLALILFVEALRDWRKRGKPLFLVLFIGGIATNPLEGVADHLGFVWYAIPNTPTWYESFVAMPLWILPAYPVFFAGLTIIVLRWLEAFQPRRVFIATIAVCWAINLAIEVPLVHFDAYTYYGNQPASFFGVPYFWLVVNTGAPIVIGVLIHRFDRFFEGRRLLLLIPLMPMVYGAFQAGTGWPIFNLLHSTAPQWLIEVGTLLTMALGLTIYWFVMELGSSNGRFRDVYRAALIHAKGDEPGGARRPSRPQRTGPERPTGRSELEPASRRTSTGKVG